MKDDRVTFAIAFSKFLFVIMGIGIIVYSIILFNSNSSLGWFVLISGALIEMTAIMFTYLFISIAENTADVNERIKYVEKDISSIKKLLSSIIDANSSATSSNHISDKTNITGKTGQVPNMTQNQISETKNTIASALINSSNPNELWICANCGEKNPQNMAHCRKCAQLRKINTGNPANAIPDYKYWVCSNCGENNYLTIEICERCGQKRE